MNPRQLRIEGDVAHVQLTRGYVAVIDAADAQLVAEWNWCANVRSGTVYAVRVSSRGEGKRRTIQLHRVLMSANDGTEIDHRNGNGLDNRRCNLRLATKAENQWNRRISKNNTSGFKGVDFDKSRSKWRARIKLNGKDFHLGLHDTPERAHKAYVAASTKLHGDFGRTA